MVKMRYFDKSRKALVYIQAQSSPQMWDTHWSYTEDKARLALDNIKSKKPNFIVRVTIRYLTPESGLILEGGCGMGQHVANLTSWGYSSLGIDFAPQTVETCKRVAPWLDIRLGDVRALPLTDHSVAGYWSLGVIEHFYSGYDQISHEMRRVIKPGGYLFLTHPYMSPLRRLKVLFRLYDQEILSDEEPEGFYQFALSHEETIINFAKLGFSLCKVSPIAGLKGFKDELPDLFRSPLQKLYDYQGKNILIRGLAYVLDRILTTISGHSCLLIFKRN